MNKKQLLQLVAKAAAEKIPQLAPGDRADLLEGLALILPDKLERDLARHTAGLIRQADEHQLKLFQQLTSGGRA